VLDAAIVLRHDAERRDGEVIREETFGWMASPEFEHRHGEPLRLATQAEPCSVRSMALAALEEAGIAWTEVFIGGGIPTIGAAVSAGLAVAALGRRVAPSATIDVGPQLGPFPALTRRDALLRPRRPPSAGLAQNALRFDPVGGQLTPTHRRETGD